MGQYRWNHMLGEWVIITPKRAERPFQEKDHACPFCPERMTEWGDKKVVTVENKYPALDESIGPIPLNSDIVMEAPAYGACKVILYTRDHHRQFEELTDDEVEEVVREYARVFEELDSLEGIRYVLEFENRGRAIGTSLDHPHAQVYALPFVPPRIQRESDQLKKALMREHECLICQTLEKEMEFGDRVINESDNFISILPFAARLPYEVHIYSKKHMQSLSNLSNEFKELGMMIRDVAQRYAALFDDVAYSMVIHTRPSGGTYDYWHFHIEFYPPWRDRTRLKYLAGVESGAWTFTNDSKPEEKARELREAI